MPDITNRYYTEQFQGQAGQTARAEEVASEFDAVQAGFAASQVDIDRAVKAPSGETLADLPSAGTRANKWFRFDADGQPVPVSAPFQWRGLYAASTLYRVGDVMQKGVHQSLYYCKTQYTSGATFDDSKWDVFIDLSGVAFFDYLVVNGSGEHDLQAGDSVLVDSSEGDITLKLPAGPALGDSPINITHVGGSLGTGQAVKVTSATGTYIMGTSQTELDLDKANASFSLFYGGAAYGWRLRVMG